MVKSVNYVWLKWLGILPCAVIAYLLTYFIGGFVFSFLEAVFSILPFSNPYGYDEDPDWNNGGFAEVLQAVFSCVAYLEIGQKISPSYKKIVSLILLIIVISVMILNVIYKIIKRKYAIYEIIACCIVGVTIYSSINKQIISSNSK